MSLDAGPGSEIQTFDELISAIYRAAVGAFEWSRVLSMVVERTDSKIGFIGHFGGNGHTGVIDESYNLDRTYVERYDARYGARAPWFSRREFFQAPGLVWTGSQIIANERIQETDFYREFLKPLGMLPTLHAVIDIEQDTLSHLFLARAEGEPDYGPVECELARVVVAHTRHANTLQRFLEVQRIIQHGYDVVGENIALGVVIVDPAGRVMRLNELAQRTLATIDPKWAAIPAQTTDAVKGHRLPALPRKLVEAIEENHRQRGVVLRRGDDMRPVFVMVRASAEAGGPVHGRGSGHVLLLCDPDIELEIDQDQLRMLYELTPTEARLSARIVSGERIFEAAGNLGMSPHTARTHLKRVFEKTNTARQAELVRVLMRSVIPLRIVQTGGARSGP
ncbi:MAG: helix-turn-helix transcriptional regulator, partial [Alphaproteobacteria bacterium]